VSVWHEPDAKFLERRQHFLLRGSRPQPSIHFGGGDRLDRVSAANWSAPLLRTAEMLDLPASSAPSLFPPRLRGHSDHRGCYRANQCLNLEPLERAFDCLFDVVLADVKAWRTLIPLDQNWIQVEPEFGGNDHLPAERSESFAKVLRYEGP